MQAAQADLANAGAQREGNRHDAETLRRLARHDGVLRSGVDDEVLGAGVVDLGADDHFLVHEPERHRVQDVQRAGIELERHFLAERPEEPDLAPRPGGLVAVILVRQQVHVVAERRSGLLVLVHPLVDRPERVVNLEVAWRQGERRLRLVQRRLELAARQERPRHPVMPARVFGRHRQRVAISRLRFLEQPRCPQRVSIERQRFGIARRRLEQLVRLTSGDLELRDAQRRLDDARPRLSQPRRILYGQRLLVRLQRVDVSSIVEEQTAQLKLDFGRLIGRRGIGVDDERCRRDDG